MRRNCVGIEPADTVIILKDDLRKLLSFIEKIANSEDKVKLHPYNLEAKAILENDGNLENWQKKLNLEAKVILEKITGEKL
jgi:hypothetical protein